MEDPTSYSEYEAVQRLADSGRCGFVLCVDVLLLKFFLAPLKLETHDPQFSCMKSASLEN